MDRKVEAETGSLLGILGFGWSSEQTRAENEDQMGSGLLGDFPDRLSQALPGVLAQP